MKLLEAGAWLVAHRRLAVGLVLAFTAGLGVFAARVRPDYSIEMMFPRFDRSRVDYERFRLDFAHEDGRALVVVQAADLFTPAGLKRVAALEEDLARVAGVIDTEGLTTVRHMVAEGDAGVRLERLFPDLDAPPAELARRRTIATTSRLFAWNLAPPDGSATTIRVTLTREVAGTEAARTQFYHAARAVVARHEAHARAAGVPQRLTLSGLPVIRSQFNELINRDLATMFPIALAVILLLLYLTFRSGGALGASVITIGFSVVWTYGFMGLCGLPLQVLTNVTPTIIMIISISDTVHIVTQLQRRLADGVDRQRAIAEALAESAVPCLLTEVTIAGGFLALCLNDMVLGQQFGLATAGGVLLTWLANVTVLPLALSYLPVAAARPRRGGLTRGLERLVGGIERLVTRRGRTIALVAGGLTVAAVIAATRVPTEYYNYDDLRPTSRVYQDLRLVERLHGGCVPFAILVEERGKRTPDAMLEPAALALIDRLTRRLEADYPDEIKNAGSLSRVMRHAHRLLAGAEAARAAPLPPTRALAAQELLMLDDPRVLRDYLALDRATGAVFAMLPDKGSTRATAILRTLRAQLDREEAATGYRLTITGIYGVADGIYRSMVGGFARSLGLAVLLSFGIFCLVLRSARLGALALLPNLLPVLLTFAIMSLLRIDLKPSTVIVFSITLVIADDDTIQYLTRFRRRFRALAARGAPDPHRAAALDTLRETGAPMIVTALAVSLGFLALLFSEFRAVATLGLLIGVSLLTAVFADLFLAPLMLMRLKPRLGGRRAAEQRDEAPPRQAAP